MHVREAELIYTLNYDVSHFEVLKRTIAIMPVVIYAIPIRARREQAAKLLEVRGLAKGHSEVYVEYIPQSSDSPAVYTYISDNRRRC